MLAGPAPDPRSPATGRFARLYSIPARNAAPRITTNPGLPLAIMALYPLSYRRNADSVVPEGCRSVTGA